MPHDIEFRKFLDRIDAAVPADLDIPLILDNYATHKTPTTASWLNLVERWFVEFQEDSPALGPIWIDVPTRVRVDETAEDAARGLGIHDEDGECTRIRFRAAPLPRS